MRYKIVKNTWRYNDTIQESYSIMKEVKKWYSKKPKWVYCREHTYASYDSWKGEVVTRRTLKDAEDYIKRMLIADDVEEGTVDIKIYECRDSKLNKILND